MIRILRRRVRSHSVLFVQSGPKFDADGQVHASLARLLPQRGFEVFVACNPGQPPGTGSSLRAFRDIAGIAVRPTMFGPEVTSRRAVAIARAAVIGAVGVARDLVGTIRLARRNAIGIVHCTEKAREAMFAYVVARASGARLVVHLHVKVEPWFSAPTRWVMHRADRLIAISQFVGDSAVAMGYDRASVAVALNGMSPQDARAVVDPSDRVTVRAEFDVPPDTLVVTIVARLNPWKGHEALLQAFTRAHAMHHDMLLLVVGTDETRDATGSAGTALRARADSLGIAAHVRFTGFRSDTQRLLHASDVFAMPSTEEPFGLVFIEAMATGTPVLGIDNGGTPEVVEDGVTGLLSPLGDDAALAANLLRLVDDPDLRRRMGEAGRARVASLFSAERMADDIAAIYGSLVD